MKANLSFYFSWPSDNDIELILTIFSPQKNLLTTSSCWFSQFDIKHKTVSSSLSNYCVASRKRRVFCVFKFWPISHCNLASNLVPLQWHHNGHDGISNHQPHECLLKCLVKAHIQENIKAPHHWPLCRELTGDWWIPRTPAQRASNKENVSIWWRHHADAAPATLTCWPDHTNQPCLSRLNPQPTKQVLIPDTVWWCRWLGAHLSQLTRKWGSNFKRATSENRLWINLTHLPLVPHICLSKMGQHLFR